MTASMARPTMTSSNGRAGNDNIFGEDGNDDLNGGRVNDQLCCKDGDDYLDSWTGDDILNGGNGHDQFQDDDGSDTFRGGAGVDSVSYYFGGSVTVNLATGIAIDAEGTDTLDSIENVFCSEASDTLIGNAEDNSLDCFDRADVLKDGGGNDYLFGGFADALEGGGGDDRLIGGQGKDTLAGVLVRIN